MAKAALRLARSGQPEPPAQPAVIVPPSWENPKGDKRADGTLEFIDCVGASARIQVRVDGHALLFFVDKPGEVLLKNASSVSFEFRCGAQKSRRIVVEYRNQPDAKQSTVGVVTALEFP